MVLILSLSKDEDHVQSLKKAFYALGVVAIDQENPYGSFNWP